MKVKKKDEKLARAMIEFALYMCRFPKEKVESRVNEAWPGYLNQAKFINLFLNHIDTAHLDGETTEKAIETWES